jgi:hypothetical protein
LLALVATYQYLDSEPRFANLELNEQGKSEVVRAYFDDRSVYLSYSNDHEYPVAFPIEGSEVYGKDSTGMRVKIYGDKLEKWSQTWVIVDPNSTADCEVISWSDRNWTATSSEKSTWRVVPPKLERIPWDIKNQTSHSWQEDCPETIPIVPD